MKIAFFSDCYLDLTGGIRSSISAQKAALEANGHEVYLFSTGFPRSAEALDRLAEQNIFQVPSCRLFFRGLTPISRRPRIIQAWLENTHPELKDFDIYYIHYEAGCSIAGLLLGQKFKIPTVQVMHGREDMGETHIIPRGLRTIVAVSLNWLHSRYIPHKIKVPRDNLYASSLAKAKMWELMVNHANFADATIVPSAHFKNKLIHYGASEHIRVIPNGFPDAKFPSSPTIKSLAPRQELKIIWHSRVSAEKRMMPFLRALLQVKGRYHLDVYGGGGDYFRARRFVKRHHLNVTFHGNASFDAVQAAIADSHLDVLVSYDFDTFGMTLIEAEAAGVPVFICDPDLTETVPAGSFIITEGQSSAEMAAALSELIKHPARIPAMSKVMLSRRDDILISRRIRPLERLFLTLKKQAN